MFEDSISEDELKSILESEVEEDEDDGDYGEVEEEATTDTDQDDETGETEDDGEGEEEEEGFEDTPIPGPTIPKKRLDQVIAQREELKNRNQLLEDQLAKLIELSSKATTPTKTEQPVVEEPEYDFDAAEESYATLLIEGETSKAAKLRNEIERERDKYYRELILSVKSSALEEAKNNSSKIIEDERFEAIVGTFEAKYPFLDHNSDVYNEEAVDTINALMVGLQKKGMGKAVALKTAIDKVLPMYEVKAKPAPAKATLGEQRKKEAGVNAAKAASAQPPKTGAKKGESTDMSKINISKMSEKDFNKLTEKELKMLLAQ